MKTATKNLMKKSDRVKPAAKAVAVNRTAKANGKPPVQTKAKVEACKTCNRPMPSAERSDAAKRAWDTIRANREAGFKTSADRKAAEVKTVKSAKAPKAAKAKKATKKATK